MKQLISTVAVTALLALGACADNSTKDADKSSTTESKGVSMAAVASQTDIARRIKTLASDEFEGRAPSTPGGQKASQYIADEMKESGLIPMGKDGTYFQPVTLTASTVSADSTYNFSKDGKPLIKGDAGDNVVFWSKRMDPSISVEDSELIFVGYGTVAPEYGWNDYEGLDVKGKTVVMLVNDPGFATKDKALFNGEAMTYYGRWTYKFEEAGRQGAAAVIVIHETKPASYPWEVVSGGWTGEQYDLVRPDGGANRSLIESWVNVETAQALFDAAGLDFDAQKKAAQTKGFKPVAMNGLTLSTNLSQSVQTVESRNVVGGIKGTTRPDEYVLYMAHWDHLGKTPDGEIFNGAVDNATGTSLLLEVGEAFAEKGAPERSAIFVAVTAEESGLLGSAYYGADPVVPLNKTVAGINMDGVLPIGPTKDMIVIGYGASELEDRLQSVLDKRDMYIAPDTKPEAGYFYRSDHISLAKLGVPMIYSDGGVEHVTLGRSHGEKFAEDYTKNCYHKSCDEFDESWDLSGLELSADILFELGYNIADGNDWPNWYEGNEFRSLRDKMMAE